MEYMFVKGFLGTRAPLFMDVVTLIVVLLPLLVAGAIAFARAGLYKVHSMLQGIIFIVSVVVLAYFEYGVRLGGGFGAYMEGSAVGHNYALIVLIVHIIIAVITLGFWVSTLVNARRDRKYKALPGVHSSSHRKAGVRTFIGIVLTSVTGLWVYLLLFVY